MVVPQEVGQILLLLLLQHEILVAHVVPVTFQYGSYNQLVDVGHWVYEVSASGGAFRWHFSVQGRRNDESNDHISFFCV